jgi:hypothetical protein
MKDIIKINRKNLTGNGIHQFQDFFVITIVGTNINNIFYFSL